ncbi:MAG: right-handed parallel beta-helix repeat-containing protein [Thermoplasmatales archaeon]|nr:MAG: right-handed parallel beta-helix repeat-containing protein [Thermoplasmatales archaeon]
MKYNPFRKVLVLGIIIIFFCTCTQSSMGEVIENINNFSLMDINTNGITLNVGGSGPDNYTKIQYAIDNASAGDTVFVYSYSSPYYENVFINKSIRLIGEDPTITTIIGNYSGCTIEVYTSNVSIFGFCIKNGNLSGIKLWKSENCSIANNIIEMNNRYGISLIESCNNFIEVNYINDNENGIKLSDKSNFNLIKGNIIEKNYNGIFLESSSENLIINNELDSNEYGLKIYYRSRYNTIEQNIISNNILGIFLGGTIYPTFIFNILIDGSTHNKIIKNNFFNNSQDAFFQNSRRNRWWRNYWNETRLLPKLIFGELFICRLQGIPPTAIEHHIPWIPRIDWRPALKPFNI